MNRTDNQAEVLTDLVLEIFRVNGRLVAYGDELTGAFGLTSARWKVMGAVAVAGQPLTVARIAHNMGLARQSVQRLVDSLATQGLICLLDNPADRRARLVDFTPRGREIIAAVSRQWDQSASSLARRLPGNGPGAALGYLRALREILETTNTKEHD